jgi:hypothetical protein
MAYLGQGIFKEVPLAIMLDSRATTGRPAFTAEETSSLTRIKELSCLLQQPRVGRHRRRNIASMNSRIKERKSKARLRISKAVRASDLIGPRGYKYDTYMTFSIDGYLHYHFLQYRSCQFHLLCTTYNYPAGSYLANPLLKCCVIQRNESKASHHRGVESPEYQIRENNLFLDQERSRVSYLLSVLGFSCMSMWI